MKRTALAPVPLLLSALACAQWTDIQHLGTGGESYVSTDGAGNVYATSHQPCKLYVSHDFGKTFGISHDLPESMCDVTSVVAPNGKLYVIYIRPNVSGMQVVTSADRGATIEKAGVLPGPFDREWIVVNPKTGEVGFNYSNGYIGGPKSKGVFYAASADEGKSFREVSRIDKEAPGSYPVDPYLTMGSGGRIYAGWATSTDYDHIDAFKVATSDDGGKTWQNHTTIGNTHAAFGDTQERWMLGSLVASGENTAMMVYEDYMNLDIDGVSLRPLLVFYRTTVDGGRNWSSSKPVLSPREIQDAMRAFVKSNGPSASVKTYVQTLPWLAADPSGRIHMTFVDNRDGVAAVGDKKVSQWHVRFTTWSQTSGFGQSERVSHDWAAMRPPLDFVGCCADDKNAWVIWTENPQRTSGWDFSGELYIGRKALGS